MIVGDRRPDRPGARPAQKARHHVYDVAVVGGQLGGAVAGALLAKRGYRVLHLDHDGLGSGYLDRGYRLPYAPSILPPLKAMPAADAALVELGISADVYRQLQPAEPDLQVLLPRHRIDLSTDPARRAAELTREFGQDARAAGAAIDAVLSRGSDGGDFLRADPALPPMGFLDRFRLSRLAARFPGARADPGGVPAEGTPLAETLAALTRFVTYLENGQQPGLAPCRPLSLALRGAHVFPGGVDGLREVIRHRIEVAGGDLLGGEEGPARVQELVFEGSRAAGVQLAGPAATVRARCVVAATDPAALRRLVPPKRRQRRLSEMLDAVRTLHYLFPVNLVLRGEGIPPGLGDAALVLSGESAVGPVLLQVLPARRADEKPPAGEEKLVALGAFVPAATRDLSDAELRRLADEIVAAAGTMLPFFERHEVLRSAPYLDARGTRGSRLLPHPRLEVDLPRHLGVTGIPPRTSVRNLFVASREVLPGLGLEGEFIAGQRVAGMVHEVLRRFDPLR